MVSCRVWGPDRYGRAFLSLIEGALPPKAPACQSLAGRDLPMVDTLDLLWRKVRVYPEGCPAPTIEAGLSQTAKTLLAYMYPAIYL